MSKSRVFLIFEITFLISVSLIYLYMNEQYIEFVSSVIFVWLICCAFLLKKFLWRDVFFVVCFGVIIALLRCFFVYEEALSSEVFKLDVLEGCVVDEPDVRVDKVKYVLKVASWKILINLPRYPVYEYGDCFVVSGRLEKPGKIEDFDYGKYLERYGISGVIYKAEVVSLKSSGGFGFRSLYFFKNIFSEQLKSLFGEPYSGFMAGIILGARSSISDDLMEQFNTTGLTHIVAISGYNITLLINILASILVFLKKKTRIFVSCVFIIVFVVFVGASSSVVRAGIMGVIGLISLWFGRQYYAGFALLTTFFVMVLWNPLVISDVGLQLSFLATVGLIYISPLIEKYFNWMPEMFGFRESLTMTMSAQITSVPIILYYFERLSVVSPIANLFVLPFIPFAMLFGFLAVVCGFLLYPLGQIISFFGYLVSKIIFFFVGIFAYLPFASIGVGNIPSIFLFVYYFIVLKLVIRKYLSRKDVS